MKSKRRQVRPVPFDGPSKEVIRGKLPRVMSGRSIMFGSVLAALNFPIGRSVRIESEATRRGWI
jgi:hypothetical protein